MVINMGKYAFIIDQSDTTQSDGYTSLLPSARLQTVLNSTVEATVLVTSKRPNSKANVRSREQDQKQDNYYYGSYLIWS